jgi:hypothetical protein
MKKIRIVGIVQLVLSGIVLWQTRAVAGCYFDTCPNSWITICGPGCSAGALLSSESICCTPTAGNCCSYAAYYYQCNPAGCSNQISRNRLSGPAAGTCTNGSCNWN